MLVGEMRDLETIESALRIAETGHLTLATLHTNSAASTINRIIDVFPSDQQAQVRAQFRWCLKEFCARRYYRALKEPVARWHLRSWCLTALSET